MSEDELRELAKHRFLARAVDAVAILDAKDAELARLREVAAATSLPRDLFEIARLRAALDAIDHGDDSAAKTLVCADCGLRSATVKDGLCYRCTPT